MKKFIFLLNIAVLSFTISAQTPVTISENVPVLIYSLPKTELCIEVVTEKTTLKPGQFYKYSERYLATSNVITEEKISYKLVSIKVTSKSVPDLNRTYSFIPSKNAATYLSLNTDGIISGINMPTNEKCNKIKSGVKTESDKASSEILPLGEEYMMAGSEAKLAEGAAKQIYRIRESRLGILTADVEKLPADGSSFKTVLNGLNNMEQQLTELFVGKTTIKLETQQIYLTPTIALKEDVLFRLSAFNGVVAASDLSGKPYFISITPKSAVFAPSDGKTKHNATLYSILPASTQISIGDGVNTYFSDRFQIPQFGVTIPVSEDILKNTKTKISFDTETGRILSIQ